MRWWFSFAMSFKDLISQILSLVSGVLTLPLALCLCKCTLYILDQAGQGLPVTGL